MSAIVCGKRSNLFEDFQSSPSSLSSPSPPSPVSKRIRRSFSPSRSSSGSDRVFSGNSIASSALDYLVMRFSDMDKQVYFFFPFFRAIV